MQERRPTRTSSIAHTLEPDAEAVEVAAEGEEVGDLATTHMIAAIADHDAARTERSGTVRGRSAAWRPGPTTMASTFQATHAAPVS